MTIFRSAFVQSGDPSPECVKSNHTLSVRRQCELLGLPRSKVYYRPVKASKEEQERRERIMERIDYWHTTMPYIGTRKLVRKLKSEGIYVGRKLVRKLMEEMGIHVLYPKANLSKRNFKEAIIPYRLRNKVVFLPNQVWSIDITYIKMNRSHMYLTAIIDWHSRYIVGWNLSDTLDSCYVIQAVKDAVAKYGIPAFLNSDQGCQFTSQNYKNTLKDLHIIQSMNGKSRWSDNIMIERWFRSLKIEEIYLNEYDTPRELRKAIRSYIEQYNSVRPHEALDYDTPQNVYTHSFLPSSTDRDALALAG